MNKCKLQAQPGLVQAVKRNFGDLKPATYLASVREWYQHAMVINRLLVSISGTLLTETNTSLVQAAARNRTILRLFEQMQSRFLFPDESSLDFAQFGFRKSKKAKNLKRIYSDNTDVLDFLVNFRDEAVELADSIQETEAQFKKRFAKNHSEEEFRVREERLRSLVASVKSQQRGVESDLMGLDNKFNSVVAILEKNLGASMAPGRETGIPESSKRNTLEILSVFFYFCKKTTTTVRNFALSALQALSKARAFELENIEAIKSAIESYGIAMNEVYGNSSANCLKKTEKLLAKLNPKTMTDELFKPELLLSVEEVEGIKRHFFVDTVDEIFLHKFIKETTTDSSSRFLERLTLKVWKGLVVGDHGIPFQALIKVTREGTFAVYKFDFTRNEVQLHKTIWLEFASPRLSTDEAKLSVCYAEGNSAKGTLTVTEFLLDAATRTEMATFLAHGTLTSNLEKTVASEDGKLATSMMDPDTSMKSEKTSETMDESQTVLGGQI
jgi:hypothetical protein